VAIIVLTVINFKWEIYWKFWRQW